VALSIGPNQRKQMKYAPAVAARGRHKNRGFTLIEVMIVVAIIGVLSAIALPAYQSYILKSRRADAKNAVLDMASRQERFFSMNNKYSGTAADLGYAVLPSAVNSSGSSYYDLTVTTSTGPAGFVAKATPTGSQQRDAECYAFQVDQTGAQSNLLSDGTKGTSTNCW
jgi:type IV pilus assembly protein PilE